MAGDEISLLVEELIQLTVKSSLVAPKSNLSLLCYVWTRKPYNPDTFRAQLRSIWKMRRKFEIQVVGQNILKEATERSNIKLIFSSFWLKIGLCPPECEKKDLMHAIDSTFRGILRSEIKSDVCRLKVQLNARKPLRRGIFNATGDQEKVWLSFKYEVLSNFCFGCGCMGYVTKDCTKTSNLR
ncbi:hypothetical protein J1N35_002309 [Gossypium stocksii]|uniref:Zinc knuckle CX2CX4HX4C domain-containing protein n=1 Tax=Gossypium stocksii TaxID=47602 RepID=A0A9D3WL18_9ROSI|nr:hypothetical protein J1N35_002309 [Gossypium stocksii]